MMIKMKTFYNRTATGNTWKEQRKGKFQTARIKYNFEKKSNDIIKFND